MDEQYRRHFHSNLQQRQQQRHQQLQSQQANSTASTASDSTTTAAAPTATATATANALLSQSSQVPLYDRGTPPSLHHGFGLGSGTWAAAIREAAEELGCLPTPLQLITAHNVYRGDGCKRYTVYVCKVAEATKTALRPPLSEEHAAYGWFPVAALFPLVAATGGRFEVHPWYGETKRRDTYFWDILLLISTNFRIYRLLMNVNCFFFCILLKKYHIRSISLISCSSLLPCCFPPQDLRLRGTTPRCLGAAGGTAAVGADAARAGRRGAGA